MSSSAIASRKIPFQFRWIWFLGAFAIGVLYVYTVRPRPTVVFKYPTPYNSGKVIYADHVGNCYKFQMEQRTCPTEKEKDISVEPQPIV